MKGKDVYWEVQPPFAVSRVLGLAPFDERFNMSKFHLGWTLAVLGVTFGLGTYLGLFMERTNKIFELSPFSLILERAQLLIVVSTVVASAFKAIANVRTLHKVMAHLASLDSELREIGVMVPYSRLYGAMFAYFKLILIMSLCFPDLIVFKSFRNFNLLIVQYILIMPLLVGNIVQAKEFNENLYQVMIDDEKYEIAESKKLRLHVTMNREIVFTAWGFFTLDYTLVHSMIAAATTYLVILIQFGEPTSAPDTPKMNTTDTM